MSHALPIPHSPSHPSYAAPRNEEGPKFLTAAAKGNVDEVRVLFERVDLLFRDEQGNLFVTLIPHNNHNHSQFNPSNCPHNYTALHFAVRNNHIPVVRAVLAKAFAQNRLGELVGAIDRFRTQAMHLAQSPECVGVLLDAGAQSNAMDAHGRTPLHEMAERGDVASATELLDHCIRAEVAFKNATKQILVKLQTGLVAELIDLINTFSGDYFNSNLVNQSNQTGRSPLYTAIASSLGDANEDMVKFLLARRANANISVMHSRSLTKTSLLVIAKTIQPPIPKIAALIEEATKPESDAKDAAVGSAAASLPATAAVSADGAASPQSDKKAKDTNNLKGGVKTTNGF